MCYLVIDLSASYTGSLTRTAHHHTIHPTDIFTRPTAQDSVELRTSLCKEKYDGHVFFYYLSVHYMDRDVPASMVTEASMLPCIFIPTITNEARRHRPHLRHFDTKT